MPIGAPEPSDSDDDDALSEYEGDENIGYDPSFEGRGGVTASDRDAMVPCNAAKDFREASRYDVADASVAAARDFPDAVLRIASPAGVRAQVSRFNRDGSIVVVGGDDGAARAYHARTGAAFHQFVPSRHGGDGVDAENPGVVTSLRFLPSRGGGGDGGSGGGGGGGDGDNVALVASSSGRLWHWHCTSGKTIGAPVVEPGNQILACDVRGDGETFATAGYDGTIRVYDEATRKLRASLRGWSAGEDPATGAPTRPPWKPAGPPKMVHVGNGEYREKSIVNPVKDCGHADRVLGLAYASDSHDVLVSGGWDNTLQMWDARAGPTSVRRVRGPHVCGDSIHVTPLNDDGARAQVLCGSWRTRRPLQAFDLGTFMFMYEVPFGVVPDAKGEENANANATPCSVYAARFGKDGGPCEGLIFAGGSGGNEVRVISRPGYGDHSGGKARSVFFALVPIRPRSRGERRFLMRSFFAISRVVFLSADPPLGFNARPRRLSTLTDAFELHPDVCRFA